MKLPISSTGLNFNPRGNRVPSGRAGEGRSDYPVRQSKIARQGVALVITLILLSVITFMAVTFLVVTRGEKSNVVNIKEQTTARLANDTALEVAKTELISAMMAYTNQFNISLLVSTNYIRPGGYLTGTGPGSRSLTNVGYTYPNGADLSVNDGLQNLANLLYMARPPVFITNRLYGSNEFSFYLDLNRNQRFDPNGLQPVMNPNGGYYNSNGLFIPNIIPGNTLSNFVVGDPEWVGMLQRGGFPPSLMNPIGRASIFPFGFPHSATNQFISRYAFIVIPASETLDVNYIHNYARQLDRNMSLGVGDAFQRNMGAGSWEINFGSFLTDLNTNLWPASTPNRFNFQPYSYNPAPGGHNDGAGFQDALCLLRYRYNTAWSVNLASVPTLFGTQGRTAFVGDNIDGYSFGPVMTSFRWTPAGGDGDATRVNFGWPGSPTPNQFADSQDFFDKSKTAVGSPAVSFSDRLLMAGTNTSTYDRTTLYRMLAQLGTDSAPEDSSPRTGKLNLNYVNVDNSGKIAANMATNFQPWTAIQFFTNTALRLLLNEGFDTNVVATNVLVAGQTVPFQVHIQVYPTNYYSPSVHQMLQLAANIYDASITNKPGRALTNYPYLPSVFRPIFTDTSSGRGGTRQIYISGFEEVTNISVLSVSSRWHDLLDTGALQQPVASHDMVYGVPLVVGTKKGWPTFNKFAGQTDVLATRRIRFHRDTKGGPITTNQIFSVTVTNNNALEAWNSYAATLPNNFTIYSHVDVILSMTNETGLVRGPNNTIVSNMYSYPQFASASPVTPPPLNVSVLNQWPGSGFTATRKVPSPASFQVPITNKFVFVTTNLVYSCSRTQFVLASAGFPDPPNTFPVPHLWLKQRSRIIYALVDNSNGDPRIVDFVNLNSEEPPLDITDELKYKSQCTGVYDNTVGSLFCTNRVRNPLPDNNRIPTYGALYQLGISGALGFIGVPAGLWGTFGDAGGQASSVSSLQAWLGPNGDAGERQTGFTPSRLLHDYTAWEANDPLVHYTVSDLVDSLGTKKHVQPDDEGQNTDSPLLEVRAVNDHYRPWAWKETTPPSATIYSIKDPLIRRSDDWDFPNGKYPNIGWLGRVHRGTPWQTVFLKAAFTNNYTTNLTQLTNDAASLMITWGKWSGHVVSNWDGHLSILNDYVRTHPTNDYHILDLFTTAFNDNASRGQLSVNQSGLAAWSALLGGVNVATSATNTNSFVYIQPAGVYDPFVTNTSFLPPMVQIVNGINKARTNSALFNQRVFTSVGDVLAAKELTVASPYLAGKNPNELNDEVYERIPQQILGLLRGGEKPRFVIYAYGQALKPADHSLYTASGPFFGMCTNYQVTAESATRAVVRIEGDAQHPHVVVENFNVLGPY